MRTLRRILTWGRCPQTPGIFRSAARMHGFEGAGCARPRPIPAAESALGLRSRSALSSAQVLPEWTTSTSPCNNFLSNGDNPLNSLSHSKGSLQFEHPSPAQPCRNHPAVSCETHADPLPRHFANNASLAFCIRRAASVSLMCLAWRWSKAVLTPSFRYCCQSASDVSFSNGV